MKRSIAVVCLILLVGACLADTASEAAMNVMTGREKGTYYQFGLEPAAAGQTQGDRSRGAAVHRVDREPVRRVQASEHPARHRAVGRARLRLQGAEQPDVDADRAEDRGLPALQRGNPPAGEGRHPRLRRAAGPARRGRRGGQRHLPHRAPAVRGLGRQALRNGPDRDGRGARPAQGGHDRRHVLRGRLPGSSSSATG